MRYVFALILLAGAAIAAVVLPDERGTLGLTPGEGASVVALSLLALMILFSAGSSYRGRIGAAIAGAIAWAAIFAAVMVGYTFRDEMASITNRVMDEIVPGRSVPSGPGEAIAVRRPDGHFVFDMRANGLTLRFLFDTGASSVVLRAEDAARIGFDPKTLDYRVNVQTANGRTVAAPVVIDALSVGGITQRRVRALVARPGVLHENLLGQSFLQHLSGYSVERNRLVLRQ
jgi:aspartyl protease family protein